MEFNEAAIAASLGLDPPGKGDWPARAGWVPDFESPRDVLRFVLESAPNEPVVYPSERYYYYRFPLGPRLVSGNIRFAEVESGRLSVGYFDSFNTRDLRTAEFVNGQDGVRLAFDPDRQRVRLELEGVSREFVLDRRALDTGHFRPLEGERLVSGVLDESGYSLYLVYWPEGRAWYYVLNEHMPRPEPWKRGLRTDVEVYFGDRTRFCFVRHPASERFILAGVQRKQIELNTWYDGPFDQVPPHLPIRALLEESYPYVRDAGGIDEHGNFLTRPGHRVAISPYQEYESGVDLETGIAARLLAEASPRAWAQITYEPKRDWRAPSGAESSAGHTMSLSGAWPANHWGSASRLWGASHGSPTSTGWPSNHVMDASAKGPGVEQR